MFRNNKQPVVQRHLGATPDVGYGDPDDGQDYVDRGKLDFDPVNGLLSGTAIPVAQHYQPQHLLAEDGPQDVVEAAADEPADEPTVEPTDEPTVDAADEPDEERRTPLDELLDDPSEETDEDSDR
jgi:hypothetical protein